MMTQPERGRLEPKSSHSKYSFHHVIAAKPYNELLKDESDTDTLRHIGEITDHILR